MGLLISLIWSAKEFLNESALNFSFVILVGVIFAQMFILLSSFFTGVMNEFSPVINSLEVVILSSAPLICSTLLTWFVCAEVPTLDIVIMFSVLYYIYVKLLCYPRCKVSGTQPKKQDDISKVVEELPKLLIPLRLMKLVYTLPILSSLAIHLAVHHNVLATGRTRFINFAVAFFLPVVLMALAANRQRASVGFIGIEIHRLRLLHSHASCRARSPCLR